MLAHVTNGLYIAGANGPFYVIISLDFSVTFDTLSHLLFLKKNFFFSFCDILSRPSSLGILFQAPFSLHAPHILVLPSARRPYLFLCSSPTLMPPLCLHLQFPGKSN